MPIPIGENPDEGLEYVTPQPDFSETDVGITSPTQPGKQPRDDGDPDANYGGENLYGLAGKLMRPPKWVKQVDPKTGLEQAVNIGGWNAKQLEDWIASFGKPGSPEYDRARKFADDALIQKDYWIHQAHQASQGRGPGLGGNSAWQQLAAQNPEWGGSDIDWAKWFELANQAWPAGYGEDQSTLNWNPAALPQQYRQGAQNWFQQQGFRPTGSLGQYGYTQFQRAQGQPYKPISIDALNAIPDEQLRQWMLYLGSLGGLIPGSYQRPKV